MKDTLKRPLLSVALLYVTGVLIADSFSLPLITLLASSWLLALLCLIPSRARPHLLALLLVLLGTTNLTLQTVVLSPHDLRRLVGDGVEDVALRGRHALQPGHLGLLEGPFRCERAQTLSSALEPDPARPL